MKPIISDIGGIITEHKQGSSGSCQNRGYKYITASSKSYHINSDSFPTYRNLKDCVWYYYAPNAQKVTIDIYECNVSTFKFA